MGVIPTQCLASHATQPLQQFRLNLFGSPSELLSQHPPKSIDNQVGFGFPTRTASKPWMFCFNWKLLGKKAKTERTFQQGKFVQPLSSPTVTQCHPLLSLSTFQLDDSEYRPLKSIASCPLGTCRFMSCLLTCSIDRREKNKNSYTP